MTATDTTPMPTEVELTREIAATPERIHALILDPQAMMRWFGMEGFTNLEAVCEARPGGHWHVVSRAPDGAVMRMEGEILALEPRRILQAWRSVAPDGSIGNETRAEILLDPVAGGTRVTVRHSRILHTPHLFEAGWTTSLSRLATLAA